MGSGDLTLPRASSTAIAVCWAPGGWRDLWAGPCLPKAGVSVREQPPRRPTLPAPGLPVAPSPCLCLSSESQRWASTLPTARPPPSSPAVRPTPPCPGGLWSLTPLVLLPSPPLLPQLPSLSPQPPRSVPSVILHCLSFSQHFHHLAVPAHPHPPASSSPGWVPSEAGVPSCTDGRHCSYGPPPAGLAALPAVLSLSLSAAFTLPSAALSGLRHSRPASAPLPPRAAQTTSPFTSPRK